MNSRYRLALKYLYNINGKSVKPVSRYSNRSMGMIIQQCASILSESSSWATSDPDTPNLIDVYNEQGDLCFQVEYEREDKKLPGKYKQVLIVHNQEFDLDGCKKGMRLPNGKMLNTQGLWDWCFWIAREKRGNEK